MPATTFDTSGKSAAVIQGADSLRRAEIERAFLHGMQALGVTAP
jgi:hypothetical protein